MSIDFLDRRRAERFAQLLDETNGGPRHHSHGRGDDDLPGLAAVGRTMTSLRTAVRTEVDPEFRMDLRALLIATAEREGIGVTAEPDAAAEEPRSRWLTLGAGSARRLRARGAIVAGVAVGAVAVSGMSFASEDAVPGDALYGVKRSTEKAQLALAGSDVTRGQLFLGFARNRLAEASAVQAGGAGLAQVLADMDDDTRQGVRLLTGAAVQRKEAAPLDAVDVFVAGQRRQIQPLLTRAAPADREQAITSMNLLDDIQVRVDGLRKSLDCGTLGTDALGPLPQTCTAAPQGGTGKGTNQDTGATGVDGTGERAPAGSGGTQQNEQGTTGTAPQGTDPGTGTGAVPGTGTDTGTGGTRNGGTGDGADPTPSADAVVPTAEPSPDPEQPADQSTQDDEDLVDSIFGGILGND